MTRNDGSNAENVDEQVKQQILERELRIKEKLAKASKAMHAQYAKTFRDLAK